MDSKTYVAARRNGLASRLASSIGRPAALRYPPPFHSSLRRRLLPKQPPKQRNLMRRCRMRKAFKATQSVSPGDNSKTKTSKSDEALTEIVITGVRASLAQRTGNQAVAPTVVDAITAEGYRCTP